MADLTKEQIERYLRQIIMPHISGLGQQKLLKSKVQVYSKSFVDAELVILYLAAMGIGAIDCYISNYDDETFDCLLHAKDLNPDCTLVKYNLKAEAKVDFSFPLNLAVDHILVIGTDVFIEEVQRHVLISYHCEMGLSIPLTVIKTFDWRGCIYNASLFMLNTIHMNSEKTTSDSLGLYFSKAWGGVLATIEIVKSVLGLGSRLKNHSITI